MKRFLKYLIFSILAVALYKVSGESGVSSSVPEPFSGSSIESVELTTFLSEPQNDFCLPRQITYSSPARLKSGSRRTENVLRQNVQFVKSGSVVNPSVRLLVQHYSTTSFSSLSDPSARLVRMRKFVI